MFWKHFKSYHFSTHQSFTVLLLQVFFSLPKFAMMNQLFDQTKPGGVDAAYHAQVSWVEIFENLLKQMQHATPMKGMFFMKTYYLQGVH